MVAEGRAVVLGASVAGLLAAGVLADQFASVVVVERDRLPADPGQRRGVPQGRQIHALLTGGQRALEDLLPGLTTELAADSVPVVDALADLRLSFNGHRFRQAPSGLTHVSASRPMLEHHIRRRTRSLTRVSVLDACDAVGLLRHGGRIVGVRIMPRDGRRLEEVIDADLVVDASGRGSRAPAWLADLGYPAPPEERIPIDLGYSTRRFRLPADVLDGDVGLLQSPTPDCPRGAALARLENDVWMLTLVGVGADHPPADVAGFSAFAASVDRDDLQLALRSAEPIDDPIAYRFAASVRHRYERICLPANLVVLGDGLCSFNPVYGQGMTVAALEARALRDRLTRDRDVSNTTVMADFARIVDVPWRLANAADRPFLELAGPPRQSGRYRASATVLDRYVERVLSAATEDPAAGRAFLRVSGLLDPPRTLFHPDLIRRTLRTRARAGAAGAEATARHRPTDSGPHASPSSAPWWVFGVIGAAALLRPVLVLAGLLAAVAGVRAVLGRGRG